MAHGRASIVGKKHPIAQRNKSRAANAVLQQLDIAARI
jgi:hypothetical protein